MLHLGTALLLLLCDLGVLYRENSSPLDDGIGVIGYFFCKTFYPYVAHDYKLPNNMKAAISPNSKVTVSDEDRSIEVSAGTGTLRTIKWSGETCKIAVVPNLLIEENRKTECFSFPDPTERFRKTLTFNRQFWNLHKGVISKCYYSEARRNFHTQEEAIAFIKDELAFMPGVYNNQGLAITWKASYEENYLAVSIQQILINGKEPKVLLGASDKSILFDLLGLGKVRGTAKR